MASAQNVSFEDLSSGGKGPASSSTVGSSIVGSAQPLPSGTATSESWQVWEDGALQNPPTALDAPRTKPAEPSFALHDNLNQLSRLVANVTEAYTAAIFLANPTERFVQLTAVHTLSRDIVPQAHIAYGCGLVGWTAQNAVRISVCPFEHDATTLLYYAVDQDLKSFIAVPILGPGGELFGVISCDSKKSYAFAKVTEKILLDCASQAATLIMLHRELRGSERRSVPVEESSLVEYIEQLRSQKSERELLERTADLPLEFVERDALVVITTDDPGAPAAAFYSPTNQVRVGHRLLELVCRHKRVICGDRNVQAQTVDDSKQRSFLSIPFHISGREAGSINLLSRAFEAFSACEIATLERVAKVLGRELELVRLRSKYTTPEYATGLMSWEQFARLARNVFPAASASTPSVSTSSGDRSGSGKPRGAYSLIRLSIPNLNEVEDFLGTAAARKIQLKLMRLVEQAKGSQAIACSLYGTQMLILSEQAEGMRISGRLTRLIERFSVTDENAFEAAAFGQQKRERSRQQPGVNANELIQKNIRQVKVESPQDGETLEELLAKSNRLLELSFSQTGWNAQPGTSVNRSVEAVNSREVRAHASNW